jgi:GAF domain-containing protein
MPLTHLSFAFHEPGATTVTTKTPFGKPLTETIELNGTRIEEAITAGRTIHIADTSELAVSKWWQDIGAASLIITPLLARDRMIGTLNLAADQAGGFSHDDAEIAGQLAAQMGVSIENMRLFNQVQTSLQEASTLYSTSLALNATQTLGEAYNTALDTVAALTGAGRISLLIGGPNPREELAYLDMVARWEDGVVTSGVNLPQYPLADAPVIGQFAQSRANLIFNDLATDTRVDSAVRAEYAERGVNALMLLPISTGATWVGGMLVEARNGQQFSNEQARVARSVLDQAALVIDSQLILNRSQQYAEREAALRSLSAALSSTSDPDMVFTVLLDGLQTAIPHDAANILVIRDGKATPAAIRGYAAQGVDEDSLRQLAIPVEAADNLRAMMNTRRPYVVADTHTYEDWVTTPETAWVGSYAGAPIFVENEFIGFISLDSSERNKFSNNQADLLQAFADQAALALQNARQFSESQRRAQFAGTISTVTAELQRTDTVDGVMQTAIRVLRDSIAEYDFALQLNVPDADTENTPADDSES